MNSTGSLKKTYRQPWSKLLTSLIFLYQLSISPDQGEIKVFSASLRCRFYPSCSQYAVQSLRQYGLFEGIVVSLRRIFRCHPWSRGGYDPVVATKK